MTRTRIPASLTEKVADAVIREVFEPTRALTPCRTSFLAPESRNIIRDTSAGAGAQNLPWALCWKRFSARTLLPRTGYLNTVTDYLKGQYTLLHAIGTPQLPAGKGD